MMIDRGSVRVQKMLTCPSSSHFAVAKIILASLESLSLSSDEKALYGALPFAGITLFGRNIDQKNQEKLGDLVNSFADLTSDFSNSPPVIAIDQEGGRVRRLKDPFFDPGPALSWAQSSTNDLNIVRAYGEKVALGLNHLGINVNFAPVCDLFQDSTHPAIGDRCLSRNPQTIGDLSHAFLLGMKKQGVLGCLKHFPGQGRATADTHLSQGLIECGKDLFIQTDLEAFTPILQEAKMIMMSHCVYPFWDDVPAGFSKKIVTHLLREKLEYQGTVLSDDLLMEAVPQSISAWIDALESCIRAGVDLLLICKDISRTFTAVEELAKRMDKDPELNELVIQAGNRVDKLRSFLRVPQ